jgi:hypothetical protein
MARTLARRKAGARPGRTAVGSTSSAETGAHRRGRRGRLGPRRRRLGARASMTRGSCATPRGRGPCRLGPPRPTPAPGQHPGSPPSSRSRMHRRPRTPRSDPAPACVAPRPLQNALRRTCRAERAPREARASLWDRANRGEVARRCPPGRSSHPARCADLSIPPFCRPSSPRRKMVPSVAVAIIRLQLVPVCLN